MTGEALSADVLKHLLRAEARATRRSVQAALGDRAGDAIADAFLKTFSEPAGVTVAGYWPIASEADVRPLMLRLAAAGAHLALPVVQGQALSFRRWRPGSALVAGPNGTRHPPEDAVSANPHLLLVPMLAFDRQGGRLGYGGGYYDRTLSVMRSTGKVTAVGVAFSAQERTGLPLQCHDQSMDWVVTEKGMLEISQ